MSTLEERMAMRPVRRWFHYVGLGFESIFEGMMTIASFGQYQHHSPEIEAILARSDRDALFDDWAKIAGDFNAVGLSMNTSLSWVADEVEKSRERGDSVEEMWANVLRVWNEKAGFANATTDSAAHTNAASN